MFRNLSRLIHSTCSSNQILIKKKLAIASSCLKGSISQKFQHERGWSVFDVCVAITSAGRSQQRSHSSSSQDRKDNNTSWPSRSTLLIVTIGACTIGSYINIRFHLANENSAASVKIGPPVGSPTLGGPFQLIDHHKKPVSEKDFSGKFLFIYFGFTYCPDICPNELIRMKEVINLLDAKSISMKVEPIFVTIDPARDGPDQLKNYLSDWHPRIIGLTGTQAQIDDICKKYRVYYSKAQLGADPSDYLIDHSVMFYLVDPNYKFVEYFAKNSSPQEIAARITEYVHAWKP